MCVCGTCAHTSGYRCPRRHVISWSRSYRQGLGTEQVLVLCKGSAHLSLLNRPSGPDLQYLHLLGSELFTSFFSLSFLFMIWSRVLQHSPGCPWTHGKPPASQGLELYMNGLTQHICFSCFHSALWLFQELTHFPGYVTLFSMEMPLGVRSAISERPGYLGFLIAVSVGMSIGCLPSGRKAGSEET